MESSMIDFKTVRNRKSIIYRKPDPITSDVTASHWTHFGTNLNSRQQIDSMITNGRTRDIEAINPQYIEFPEVQYSGYGRLDIFSRPVDEI